MGELRNANRNQQFATRHSASALFSVHQAGIDLAGPTRTRHDSA